MQYILKFYKIDPQKTCNSKNSTKNFFPTTSDHDLTDRTPNSHKNQSLKHLPDPLSKSSADPLASCQNSRPTVSFQSRPPLPHRNRATWEPDRQKHNHQRNWRRRLGPLRTRSIRLLSQTIDAVARALKIVG